MENLWAAPLVQSAAAVDRVAQLLDPDLELSSRELGPIIYEGMEACVEKCTDLLYSCTEHSESDGVVCAMDTTVLAIVIVAAVLTGFLIPIVCIVLCMCTRFCGMFTDTAEAQGLIQSDLRHDWDTSDGPHLYFNNQNGESTQISQTPGFIYPHLCGTIEFEDEQKPVGDDEPHADDAEDPKETIVSSTEM
ncbi:hypothetical protein M3Y99_01131700 [Aphelenchoides fujianensis]|nr:hypothetical protein M3Y99_01131700 [Aphelenchoides fujianensis]